MPDIQDGLTEGIADVNTEDGFVSALADKVGREVPEDYLQELRDSDTTVTAGLTSGEEKPSPRSVTPAAEVETPEEVPAEGQASEETETPAADDAVQEYIAKHGGTPEQAITAMFGELQNAQQLIGRHSEEVKAARDLQGRLEALETFLQEGGEEQQLDKPLPLASANEELEQFFEERGPVPAMTWIAENRPDLVEQAIQVWSGYDEVAAARYATRYDRFLEQEAEAAKPQAPAEDPFLANLKQQDAFSKAVESARVASNFSDEEWESVKVHVVPVLDDPNTSAIIKRAVAVPRDAEEQVEGMKALFQLASARALSAATAAATTAARKTEQETAGQRKAAARVATGSLTPPSKGESGNEEEESAERIKRFKESLMNAETTDVAAGLTYGPQR